MWCASINRCASQSPQNAVRKAMKGATLGTRRDIPAFPRRTPLLPERAPDPQEEHPPSSWLQTRPLCPLRLLVPWQASPLFSPPELVLVWRWRLGRPEIPSQQAIGHASCRRRGPGFSHRAPASAADGETDRESQARLQKQESGIHGTQAQVHLRSPFPACTSEVDESAERVWQLLVHTNRGPGRHT